jgi:hypothetical protein
MGWVYVNDGEDIVEGCDYVMEEGFDNTYSDTPDRSQTQQLMKDALIGALLGAANAVIGNMMTSYPKTLQLTKPFKDQG